MSESSPMWATSTCRDAIITNSERMCYPVVYRLSTAAQSGERALLITLGALARGGPLPLGGGEVGGVVVGAGQGRGVGGGGAAPGVGDRQGEGVGGVGGRGPVGQGEDAPDHLLHLQLRGPPVAGDGGLHLRGRVQGDGDLA